ncbi:collagen alpha-3(VI) chain-like isoform X2 [Hippocampus comes]|uniref:collagen alpha-3(VI) chain-like isoform X2 n=1 Tax=Hippocampus comes TaxID=109280 RepID=UPI00094F394C|nr:PREDICTED: collagen alpha-3(VI) chain-like isoform X2 [Hippocampus comes]
MTRHRLIPLCALVGVLLAGFLPKLDAQDVLDIGKRDIIFLLDSTMGATVINSVREFIRRFVETMPIGPDSVQVGLAQFSNVPRLEIDLNSYGTRDELMAALGRIKPRQGQAVNIGAALDFVRTDMLRPDKGSRLQQGVPQLLLLMTTKKSTDDVTGPARALQQMGVLTLAAGSKAADEQELNQIAFDESVVFTMRDFRMLLRSPKLIINALSTLAGIVVTEVPTEPVVEITTVQTQRVVRDIVFLVDGSNYIGSNNFPYVRDFMINVVNQLEVNPERVQIGLMQFAEQPKIEFYLNTARDRQDVVDRISQLRLMGGSFLNTGAAMEYALRNMFSVAAGSRQRQGVQQVLVLITGGPAQDEMKSVADKLALGGVLTFAVSSGQADQTVLQSVAFVPDLAYHEPSFSYLPAVAEQIMPKLITVVGDTNLETATEEPAVIGFERDVAFLIDGTDSVRPDFTYVRDFILKVIEPLDIGTDKVRVAVVQHSERPTPNFYLNTYQTKDEVVRAVSQMTLAGGRSLNTGSALKFMRDTILSERYGSRRARSVPQFLIVLTGSRSRDNVKEPAGALKTEGVVPFGVGVKDADRRQIEEISHNPSFAFKVKEFSELDTVPQQLNTYVSLPPTQLEIILREESRKHDVVFLIDGSYDSRNNFEAIRKFIEQMAETLSLDDRDQMAVVQYSRNSTVNFYLNSYSSKTDVLNSIRTMGHKYGRPLYLGKALEFVRDNVFAASVGGRRASLVPQYLFVFSGGRSKDDVRGPAQSLKESGIKTFSIGTNNADTLEMLNISFTPSYYFSVTSFANLPSVHESIRAMLRDIDDTTGYPPTVGTSTGTQLELGGPADIVFLLAGSDYMRANEGSVLDFVRQFVQEVEIGPSNVQVAVIQYGTEATAEFVLNSYGQKDDLMTHLSNVKLRGGSTVNTGAALDFARNYVFTASAGSRAEQGIPQTMIVLSGKKSDDNVAEPLDGLRDAGIVLYSIGIHDADKQEMEEISHSVETAYFINETSILPMLTKHLLSAILSRESIHNTDAADTDTKKDIVFLLDGSDGTKNGFPAMRDFVERAVESFKVGAEGDRVSVVQYSRDAEANFYLNTYTTREDVINAVRGLSHRGGRPLNTGAALRYVRDKIYTKASGSRRAQGVPQILILLNSRRSFDGVDEPAFALKKDGIYTICIGTQSSDKNELQKISNDKSYALAVHDFASLHNVQEQLSSVMRRVLRATSMTTTMTGKQVLHIT